LYQRFTLPNGLRLITSAMPHTRSVSISFFIGTGSRYEDDQHAGVSHFIEHMLFKGTEKRPESLDICTPIEGVGGMLNAGTDRELTIYWCKVAQIHFQNALDVLVDILLNSRLDPAEIEKERQVIIEEIKMSLDNPAQRVSTLLDEILWPDSSLGRDIAGTRESVSAIDRAMMLDYIARQYRPDDTVLSVAGDITHEEVVAAVNPLISAWQRREPPLEFAPFREKIGRRVIVEKRDTEQTQLCLALPGISIVHPDRFKLDLLNVVLGEGMSSRLFREIRDKRGLAYSIQSFAEHLLDTGVFAIAAGVDARNLKVAIAAILEEMARLRQIIPEAELTRAKELYKGRILLRMEDSRSVAGWTGGQEILTGHILTVDEVTALIDAVTSEELLALANILLAGDKLRLAVVGPVSPDEPLEDLLKL
jgi:predicted Zn-dependent peptidase